MVVLDTNVVSEMMLDFPQSEVLGWMDSRPARELFVTAVTAAEVRTGIAFLPEGARRRDLAAAAERTLGNLVCRPGSAVRRPRCPLLCPDRRRAPYRRASDLASGLSDRGHRAIARRNVQDFSGTGVEAINPWEGGWK